MSDPTDDQTLTDAALKTERDNLLATQAATSRTIAEARETARHCQNRIAVIEVEIHRRATTEPAPATCRSSNDGECWWSACLANSRYKWTMGHVCPLPWPAGEAG